MADKELSTITDASTPLDGTEKYYIVQSGNTREAAGLDILKPTLSAADQASVRSALSAALKGHIFGLTLSNSGSDDIVIAAGEAASTESNPVLMVLAASLTKDVTAAWAVGTGNGGLDTGSVTDATYYMWLIRRSDTGVVDVLFSTSSSSPTMPTNYDQKRLIGSFARASSSNLAPRAYGDGLVTPWVALSAPSSAGFGTLTDVALQTRRVAGSLEIRGRFTTGTPTATQARLSFGYGGVNGNVVGDATLIPSLQLAGDVISAVPGAAILYALCASTVDHLTFGFQNAGNSAFTQQNGSSAFGTAAAVGIRASLPIQGWQ